MQEISIENRKISEKYPPLVIAEVGINHGGSLKKAYKMVDDAAKVGCEIIKFQSHIVDDEMTPDAKKVIPGNADISIWEIMKKASLNEKEERSLKEYVESKGMIFLCTPFSRAAADRLHDMDVSAYKIGSGECNNYPLIRHIAEFKKPIILSTGMNDLVSISRSVDILRKFKIPFALLHCTSIYPTPYEKIRLEAILELKRQFKDAVVGLSDHSLSIYPCLGAVALGASILERHYTSNKTWPGPDIEISMDPLELKMLIEGSKIIHKSRFGTKGILPEEQVTIDFAYASVVSIQDIKKGELFSKDNIWVKRPGTGQILAEHFDSIIGKIASRDIKKDVQIEWDWIE